MDPDGTPTKSCRTKTVIQVFDFEVWRSSCLNLHSVFSMSLHKNRVHFQDSENLSLSMADNWSSSRVAREVTNTPTLNLSMYGKLQSMFVVDLF